MGAEEVGRTTRGNVGRAAPAVGLKEKVCLDALRSRQLLRWRDLDGGAVGRLARGQGLRVLLLRVRVRLRVIGLGLGC